MARFRFHLADHATILSDHHIIIIVLILRCIVDTGTTHRLAVICKDYYVIRELSPRVGAASLDSEGHSHGERGHSLEPPR